MTREQRLDAAVRSAIPHDWICRAILEAYDQHGGEETQYRHWRWFGLVASEYRRADNGR